MSGPYGLVSGPHLGCPVRAQLILSGGSMVAQCGQAQLVLRVGFTWALAKTHMGTCGQIMGPYSTHEGNNHYYYGLTNSFWGLILQSAHTVL